MGALGGVVVAVALGVVMGVGTVLSVTSLLEEGTPDRGLPVAQVLDYGTR